MKDRLWTAVFVAAFCALASVAGCRQQHVPPTIGKSTPVADRHLFPLLVDTFRLEYDITDEYIRYGPIIITDEEQIRQIVEQIHKMTDVKENPYPFTGVVSGEYATLTFLRKSPLRCVRLRIVGAQGVMFPESEQYQGFLPNENLWYALLKTAEQQSTDHPENVIRR